MKYWFIVLFLFVGVAQSQILDKNDPGYIQVMGVGKTVDEAKLNGFKNAITMKVGSAVLSENQVANNNLLKEELIDYSAGYIDRYAVIDTIVKPDSVVVIMQVVVRSSKIHERILNKGKDEKELDGAKLSNQYLTYLDQIKNGDRVLQAVLNDYPKRSFNVVQGPQEFKMNSNRNAVLVIPFELTWSKQYITSLNEVVKLLGDGSTISPSRVIVGRNRYNFNDYNKYEQIRGRFNSGLQLRTDMIDNNNNVIASRCSPIPHVFSGTYSSGVYVVYDHAVVRDTVQIEVNTAMAQVLKNASRIVLTTDYCSN